MQIQTSTHLYIIAPKGMVLLHAELNIPWNEIALTGNPTRCKEITQLIKAMKKIETARRGVPSKARRSCFAQDFEQII